MKNSSQVIPPDIYEKIYQKIIYFLSFKDRTEKELLDALKKYLKVETLEDTEKDYLVEKIMGDLQEEGFVDDVNYAQTYIIEVINSRNPKSKRAISAFLYRKGVKNKDVELAFDQVYTDAYELSAATKVAKKRIAKKRLTDETDIKNDVKSYLFNKGFSSGIINSVVDTKFKRY